MPKALSITGLAISVVLFILFLWDLVAPESVAPFKNASRMMDTAFVICSVILGYLSWITWREQV